MTTAAFEGRVLAHCDTTGGPVITEAKAALEKGDITPVLKWVKTERETEIKAAFAKAVAVRSKGPEAKALADQYFVETLVRVHRAGGGVHTAIVAAGGHHHADTTADSAAGHKEHKD